MKFPDSFGVFLWKNYMPLDGQVAYQDTLDFATESEWLKRRYRVAHLEDQSRVRLLEYFRDTVPEYWLPLSAFPLFEYEKKSKMYLCNEPLVFTTEDTIKSFRQQVRRYLEDVNIKKLFVPPIQSLYKTGLTKYHDNGKVKMDNERPESLASGFLYQKTMTKHLVTREIWLPDKVTKVNNSFWMNIGMQILRDDPRYPSSDPKETYELIKERLDGFAVFDLPGFGFQYPREYLIEIIDLIRAFYPSPIMEEQADLAIKILKDVKVTLPDGKILYPPRGIGLGYYESIKTIGILSLVWEYNPISVYGDQGIVQNGLQYPIIEKLNYYSFIINHDRVDLRQNTLKWSGYRMSKRLDFAKPKLVFSKVFGALTSNYHWERKKGLQSFYSEYPSEYEKIDKYVAFHYQHIFGWEFYPGDSMANFYNLGVTTSPVVEGFKRLTEVEKLVPPSESTSDINIYELPDSSTYTKLEAKNFQIKRKNLYKNSIASDDTMYLYIHPRIKQRKKVKSRAPLGALPLWADMRLLRDAGTTTGRISSGLDGVELQYAVKFQCFAPDPFRSRAMGGYDIVTQYHRQTISSYEQRTVASFLQGSEAYGHFIAYRYDQPIPIGYSDVYRYRDYSPDIYTSTLRPPKRPLSTVSSLESREIIKKTRLDDSLRDLITMQLGITPQDPSEDEVLSEVGSLNRLDSILGSLRDEEEIIAYEDIDDYMYDTLEVPDA